MMLKIILYAYTQSDFYSYYIKLHSYTYISMVIHENISTFILRITLIQTQSYLYIIKFTFDTYIEQL